MEVYKSVVGALAVFLDERKRHFPEPFDTSPVFAMWQNWSDRFCDYNAIPLEPFGTSPVFAKWQNRSDQFCHFSSTTFTLCFDQGQVLLLHAPRYMGLSRHVTLAQADMSPWRKQTCHLGVSRHVTLKQADMSLWSKQTCHFGAGRHVTFDATDMSL